MTKAEFFYFLGQGVKYADDVTVSGKTTKLNTFATLRDPTDLMAENLGKTIFDKSGNYLYSRKWEALGKPASNVVFEYPILVCYDIRPKLEGIFNAGQSKQCSTMLLSCLYPNIDKQEAPVKKAVKAFLLEEIYTATSEMMVGIQQWIKGAAYMNVDSFVGWYNQDWVADQQTAGNVTTAEIYTEATNIFRQRNKRLNLVQNGSWVDDSSKDSLCGIQMPYEFCELLCLPGTNWPMNFNTPTGYYDDDADAAANGVPLLDVYYLSLANFYGMPYGMLKQRVE